MAKIDQANNAPAQLGFLAQLGTFSTTITDLSEVAVKRDPALNARAKFGANCDETVKLIKAAEQGKFFKKLPEGYLITFRNGNSAMQLNGTIHFKVGNAGTAIKFVATKVRAETGELDQAFRNSARAARKTKTEATV
jgi:hypothetical protein